MAVAKKLTDLPKIDEEKARLLEEAGLGTLTALSKAEPKQIATITGLPGMDAIIAKERAMRAVEQGVEASGAKKLALKAKNSLDEGGKARMQMKFSSIVSNLFRKM
jgi:predicted mannosyl-3-phosphoglycerate phosphatase (HAD superfamily)